MLKETKVGWIGLGVMGSSMAKHIQDAGYSLAFIRVPKKRLRSFSTKGRNGKIAQQSWLIK